MTVVQQTQYEFETIAKIDPGPNDLFSMQRFREQEDLDSPPHRATTCSTKTRVMQFENITRNQRPMPICKTEISNNKSKH